MGCNSRTVVLIGIILSVTVITAFAELRPITKPKDTKSVVGDSAYITCSVAHKSKEIQWFHSSLGSSTKVMVYGPGEIGGAYKERFSVQRNPHTAEFKLVIRSVMLEDAGTYECQDESGLGNKDTTELIVVGGELSHKDVSTVVIVILIIVLISAANRAHVCFLYWGKRKSDTILRKMGLGKVCRYVLMAVLLCVLAKAFNYHDRPEGITNGNSSETDLKTVQQDKAILNKEHMPQLFLALGKKGGRCNCDHSTCKCLVDFTIRIIKVNFCLNMSFDQRTGAATVELTTSDHRVYHKTFSVSSSISHCIDVKLAKLCLYFNDYHVESGALTECPEIIFNILGITRNLALNCVCVNILVSKMSFPFAESPVVETSIVN